MQAGGIEPLAPGASLVSTSLPVTTLVSLGTLVTVLGLFVAGEIVVTALGLGAIAVAGVLDILGRRIA